MRILLEDLEVIYYKNHICKNEIIDEIVWLYEILKYIDRIIIRLKIIKYKKDFFYYLFL